MGLADEQLEVAQRAVLGLDARVVGDVVAVVLARRRVERQQPEGGDAEVGEVVELLGQAREVTRAVAVRVEERADVKLVDDGVLVPERVAHRAPARPGSIGRRHVGTDASGRCARRSCAGSRAWTERASTGQLARLDCTCQVDRTAPAYAALPDRRMSVTARPLAWHRPAHPTAAQQCPPAPRLDRG